MTSVVSGADKSHCSLIAVSSFPLPHALTQAPIELQVFPLPHWPSPSHSTHARVAALQWRFVPVQSVSSMQPELQVPLRQMPVPVPVLQDVWSALTCVVH